MVSIVKKIKPKHAIIGLGVVLILSIALNIFFAVQSHEAPSLTSSKYPYLDPAQSTYNNADLLVDMYPLAQELKGFVGSSTDIEIYFQYLNTGSDIRINTTPFDPGSLMKIPFAMAVMKQVESGAWSMNTELTLTDADRDSHYGTLYELPAGTTFTVAALLDDLLVQSDDTARAIFERYLGDNNVEDVLTYLGLQDVVNQDQKINAQRYSNFWRAFYSGAYLSADSSQQLLETMALPHDLEFLASGMPSSTIFSHKIGIYGDFYSDSGIVYVPNRPYILTVMVNSSNTEEVETDMKTISRDIFQYITTNNGK